MMNRIALLEQEEERIKRKMDLTRKKAKDIMHGKDMNERQYSEKLK